MANLWTPIKPNPPPSPLWLLAIIVATIVGLVAVEVFLA